MNGAPESESGERTRPYEAAKLASDFDPQNREENIDYYVAKLDELVKKFGGIAAEEGAETGEPGALVRKPRKLRTNKPFSSLDRAN